MIKTINYPLNGEPYLIVENYDGGFSVLKSLKVPKRSQTFNYTINQKVGELTLGVDMSETPSRGLTLLVEGDKGLTIVDVIEELRKLAQVSWHEYVSCEAYGEAWYQYVVADRLPHIVKTRPRLFRKINND